MASMGETCAEDRRGGVSSYRLAWSEQPQSWRDAGSSIVPDLLVCRELGARHGSNSVCHSEERDRKLVLQSHP